MYLRWKQVHYADESWPWIVHRAYIVGSRRVDGKPRQRTIAYLGAYQQNLTGPNQPRRVVFFWEHARRILDTVPFTPDERQRVEERIAAVVPSLSAADVAANYAAIQAENEVYAAAMSGMRSGVRESLVQ